MIKSYVQALSDFSFAKRISARDRVFFAKQLSLLTAADISLLESLHMLQKQSRSRGLTAILTVVIGDVQNGKALSRSLAQYPSAFGEFAIGVIAIGESSGTLSQNLEYLANELKRRRILKNKIIQALLYPALISSATFLLTCFLILYLFPKLMPIFLSLKMELPLMTRLVIGISEFLRQYGTLLLIACGVLGIAFFVLRNRPQWKYAISTYMIRTPLLRTFIRHYNVAQSTRSLGLLLKSGMPLSQSFATLSDLSSNVLYKEAWGSLSLAVNRGERISRYLEEREDLFPQVVAQMIAVGERSGNLSKTCIYIADYQESEFDEYTKSFSTLLEPILMICMGLLIGIVAISIITPIYGLTQHLHS